MWLYNIGIAALQGGIKAASLWNPKARLWSNGRKDIFNRMRRTITPGERIVWIHVASLGEFEQGRPIIEKIRSERPEYKILVTFFSPSGYEIRKNYAGADYIFYLPADTPDNARRFLDIVRPEVAIFVKYEFWLNMLAELHHRKIHTYIVSAIFRRNSIFFHVCGELWRNALNTFDTLFVQDNNSKELLSELGYDNAIVAGDTRFDRVAQIAAQTKHIELIEKFRGDKPLFIAGSTWGPDEQILQQLINENPDIKFIIAPHEMEQERITAIIAATNGGAVRYTCADPATIANNRVLILDTMGMLSSAYRYASWAYIGGGFGVGIHNTLEAATFGLPIAFGPKYEKFKEARDMVSLGAARSVASYEELKAWFEPLRDDVEDLASASLIAKTYTAKNQGATDIFFKAVFTER
ncbi:MAG: 3-deoxy-D-manno-octulosonic acid transferase [Alistipes sp.]|nr:3-deoxy-D-manno-octulosonic acid transferase [Alistipes sp.]